MQESWFYIMETATVVGIVLSWKSRPLPKAQSAVAGSAPRRATVGCHHQMVHSISREAEVTLPNLTLVY